MRTSMAYVLVFGLALSLSACGKKEAPSAPTPAPEVKKAEPTPAPAAVVDPATQAAEIFKMRCSTCHGAGGMGDGPASAGLNPKPRDLTSGEWQKSVENDYIEKIILVGGAAVEKSVAMPPSPDLAEKPEVIIEIRKIVRGLSK